MSIEIGKLRLRKVQRRLEEEGRAKAKLVIKRETKEELTKRIVKSLRKAGPCDATTLAERLRLDVMQKIRLQTLLDELEPKGIVRKQTTGKQILYEVRHRWGTTKN